MIKLLIKQLIELYPVPVQSYRITWKDGIKSDWASSIDGKPITIVFGLDHGSFEADIE